ncbi:MAG: CvpA family protein [Betaproteobacteria bacterium]|nr:CvpA family protein [Betaproteobacteria bacterium]MDH5577578.1 CvpA family protein [Betaproteobacteria bacterium]
MTWVDYLILGGFLVSIAWGAWRGLVREVISVAAWVLAFLGANYFGSPLSEVMPASIPSPELRVLIAFVAVFVVILAVCTLLGQFLRKLVKVAGLGELDHVLGGMFGVARALVILLAFAIVAGLTALPRQPLWRDSVCGPPMGRAALALRPWLPEALAQRLRYH